MSPSFSKLFVATSLVAASFAGAAPLDQLEERSTKNHTTVKPKVIMDNDCELLGSPMWTVGLNIAACQP